MAMNSEIILYQSEDGQTKVEVRMEGETVWLTLNQLVELFQKAKSTISEHIKNVFEESELPMNNATVRKFRTVQTEGERTVERDLEYYSLDVIISVGYRVKSHRGTQFRIWATKRLREYIIKGFTLDDERLKRAGQMNYFDELLARIRDIRSSEKVFYQKEVKFLLYTLRKTSGLVKTLMCLNSEKPLEKKINSKRIKLLIILPKTPRIIHWL